MRIFGTIAKIAPQADGSVRIHGVASSEAKDRHGEVVLASAIRDALPDFFRHGTGALREMHSAQRAAGTVDEVEVGDDNVTRIIATVVDSEAIKKVLAKVYKAYSVGGRVLARDPDDRTIITGIELTEVSLVDVPANPTSTLELFKAIGAGPLSDDSSDNRLAKALADRGRLAKALADRDRAIADLAGRVERTMVKVSGIVGENSNYRKQNAELTKQLAELRGPRVAVDNTVAVRADHMLEKLEKTVGDVAAQAAELSARFSKLGG
jgi:hypothetical protein